MCWIKRIFIVVLAVYVLPTRAQVLLSRNHIFGPGLSYGLGSGKEKNLNDITAIRSMGSSIHLGFHYYRNIYGGLWGGGGMAYTSYRWNFTTHPQPEPGYAPRAQYASQTQMVRMPVELMQYLSQNQGRVFLQLGLTPALLTRKAQLRKQELDADSTGFTTLLVTDNYQRLGMGFSIGIGIEFETWDNMYARLSLQWQQQYLRQRDHSVDRVGGIFLTAQYFWVQ
jgi:hypothetical protein